MSVTISLPLTTSLHLSLSSLVLLRSTAVGEARRWLAREESRCGRGGRGLPVRLPRLCRVRPDPQGCVACGLAVVVDDGEHRCRDAGVARLRGAEMDVAAVQESVAEC